MPLAPLKDPWQQVPIVENESDEVRMLGIFWGILENFGEIKDFLGNSESGFFFLV